ncbi:MAG: class I SAM-dependent methyltransferase [Ignavibacteria bacterium]|nr:class I SAM-dependent methyltransferase [Ignavibacteria bacterium]MCU7502846.1 class I SAM-dependent methyltransferase [Ignavibacteria bacterium]MCU7515660.1 class I SAM-dependent methyltransferase [Ignavibacteria bacterium]
MLVKKAYDSWSETYDSDINLTRDLDETVTRESLKGSHFNAVLELGCGTGKNTAFLSSVSAKVWAVDFSEGMLSKAREKAEARNVIFSLADVTKPWPFSENVFDLILVNLVLEHVEDLNFIFSEAARVLKRGGTFFVCELHPFRQYQGKKARFERGGNRIEIKAHVHDISGFLLAAKSNGLNLRDLREWRHEKDQSGLPRLISFRFEK